MEGKPTYKPIKVNMKSSKKRDNYLSGDLLYSGVNIFGQLSKIYLDKIENGEMIAYQTSVSNVSSTGNIAMEPETPALLKTDSSTSTTSVA